MQKVHCCQVWEMQFLGQWLQFRTEIIRNRLLRIETQISLFIFLSCKSKEKFWDRPGGLSRYARHLCKS